MKLFTALVLFCLIACTSEANTQEAWLMAGADVASCQSTGDEITAKIIEAWLTQHPDGVVAAPGDLAYENGSEENFKNCYDPSWGRFKNKTRPAPGNHEYNSANAAPYYTYFASNAGDPKKGYYSYEHGSWHVIVLNSNCASISGCDANSPQVAWLKNDLANHNNFCTLAYWHHPRFSSGLHGSDASMQTLWATLANAKTDVVLWGHDHLYERFAAMNADGAQDENGTRTFVVGMGGKNFYPILNTAPNSQIRNNNTFGALELKLLASSYEWKFMGEPGKTFTDAGTGSCH